MHKLVSIPNIYFKSYFKIGKNQYKFMSTSIANSGKLSSLTLHEDVAVIKFDNPNSKVNTLSKEFSPEMEDHFQKALENPAVKSIVLISGKTDCFIAGADLEMLASCKTSEEVKTLSKSGQQQLDRIAASSKPVVAAIMGSCLGGGLELSMACQYRIAVEDSKTRLGLPEVLLGLLPGAGGTQRLPALIPADSAADLILTGRSLSANQARRLGLVDLVVSPLGPGVKHAAENTRDYLESVAVGIARDLAAKKIKRTEPLTKQKLMRSILGFEIGRKLFFGQVHKKVMSQTQGLYPAPLKILDVLKRSVTLSPQAGLDLEAQSFSELAMTPESRALFGIYFGRNECRKNSFGAPPQPAKSVAVLGAGLMGAGIADVSLRRGFSVVMKDVSVQGLSRGQEQILANHAKLVKRKKLSSMEADKMYSQLLATTSYEDVRGADVVIEAVFEDLALKHRVIREVEPLLPAHCVLASNTSALPIADIAQASQRPERVVGMHYFSPVDRMELLEIVTGPQTSKETASIAVDLGLRQGKLVIVVRDGPGFYTTRILAPLLSEAVRLMQEGVSPTDLDAACRSFGWPVGLATLADEVGLDVGFHVAANLGNRLGARVQGSASPAVLADLVSAGFLGRKSRRGVFLYDSAGRALRQENPDALELLRRHAVAPVEENTRERVQYRLMTRFVNEAVLCLEEGVLASPVDGDIGAVFGLGFPPRFGGPFRYLDVWGAGQMVQRMEEFQRLHGSHFQPCKLLMEHAADSSRRFHSK